MGLSFNIHLRYLLCAGEATSAYCFTSYSITVAASPAYGKSPPRDVVRFPVVQEFPFQRPLPYNNRVLCDLRGRMSSGPPQPYFVEILRRGGSPAAGGKRKPHLRVWRRWGRVWLDHQGVERSVSLVCGIPCVWEKSDHGRIVALLSGILRVWEELMSKKMLFSISKRYPPVRGEDGRRLLYLAFHRAVSSCARGRPFQKCGSFSRHKGSRFADRCPI